VRHARQAESPIGSTGSCCASWRVLVATAYGPWSPTQTGPRRYGRSSEPGRISWGRSACSPRSIAATRSRSSLGRSGHPRPEVDRQLLSPRKLVMRGHRLLGTGRASHLSCVHLGARLILRKMLLSLSFRSSS
jgi:hypothetical protein